MPQAAAAAAPGYPRADRARRPGAALPHGADHAGGQPGSLGRDSGRGARDLQAVAAHAALRARRLEKALDTPAQIYYKYEGRQPSGCHKPNTAVAQAYYNKKRGVQGIVTETGAGQWGRALAIACNLFGMGCEVYMVKISYQQKPYRKLMMNTWGATSTPRPSDRTNAGRQILAQDPDRPAAWASPSPRRWRRRQPAAETKYSLGSVLNHVLLHQTVIGQEAIKQMEMAGDFPDIVIAPCRRRHQFCGHLLPLPAPQPHAGQRRCGHCRRAHLVPQADARHFRLRLWRHGRHDADAADVHAGPQLCAGRRSMPAGCATTAGVIVSQLLRTRT